MTGLSKQLTMYRIWRGFNKYVIDIKQNTHGINVLFHRDTPKDISDKVVTKLLEGLGPIVIELSYREQEIK